jgi:hypothetical protein
MNSLLLTEFHYLNVVSRVEQGRDGMLLGVYAIPLYTSRMPKLD